MAEDKQNRDDSEQTTHDNVITTMETELKRAWRKDIYTNPGQSKENPVKRHGVTVYPDIFQYVGGDVTDIYEVETSESVRDEEVDQWKRYSEGTGRFHLVVPEQSLEKARTLAEQNNITVNVWHIFDDEGNVREL